MPLLKVNHRKFMSTLDNEMRRNKIVNRNQEIIIRGAVELYYQHNKNVDYLNHAMDYARSRNGLRVNAVRAFLSHFTSAKLTKGKFTKGGKQNAVPVEFTQLESWLDWADVNAAEPEYNLAKQQLKVIDFLQKQKKVAAEHNEKGMVEMLNNTIVQYAEAQQQAAKKVAVAV